MMMNDVYKSKDVFTKVSQVTSTIKEAWVICARGGLQFCRPKKSSWDAWCPLIYIYLPLSPPFLPFPRDCRPSAFPLATPLDQVWNIVFQLGRATISAYL